MKTFVEFLGACAFGCVASGLLWLAVEEDNAELRGGKSPHSGFTPECPAPMKVFDGLSKPSRAPRMGENKLAGAAATDPRPVVNTITQ